jgi:hypothetical protein
MEFEPRHAEHDGVLPQSRYVEANGLGVRANTKLKRQRFVGDGAGRDGAAVSNMHEQRGCFEDEANGVRPDEGGVDEQRGGAGVNQGGDLDRRTLSGERYEKREVLVGGEAR